MRHQFRGYFVGVSISAAHGDGHNLWKATVDLREEIETGHSRHVQVRDNYIGCAFAYQEKRFEAILSFGDVVAGGLEQRGYASTYGGVVIHYENLTLRKGCHKLQNAVLHQLFSMSGQN